MKGAGVSPSPCRRMRTFVDRGESGGVMVTDTDDGKSLSLGIAGIFSCFNVYLQVQIDV